MANDKLCKAKDHRCHKCGKLGHLKSICRSKGAEVQNMTPVPSASLPTVLDVTR